MVEAIDRSVEFIRNGMHGREMSGCCCIFERRKRNVNPGFLYGPIWLMFVYSPYDYISDQHAIAMSMYKCVHRKRIAYGWAVIVLEERRTTHENRGCC